VYKRQEFIQSLPLHERTFDEKLTPEHKLFFDIDDSKCRLTLERVSDIIGYIWGTFPKLFGCNLDIENILVADSSGIADGKQKQSLHIIVKGYYAHRDHNRTFAEHMRKDLPDIADCIDLQVYKQNSGLRLPWCTKHGQTRPKRITGNFTDYLISNIIDCKPVKLIVKAAVAIPKHKPATEFTGDAAKILIHINKKHPKLLAGLSYRNTKGNIINFTRLEPAYCAFCKEDHHNDSALFVTVVNASAIVMCHHKNAVSQVYQRVLVDCEWITKAANTHKPNPKTPIAELVTAPMVEPVITEPKHEIALDECYNTDTRTIFDRRPMGMGKTETVTRTLVKLRSDPILTHDVVVVSFRQSFTDAIRADFGAKGINLASYQDTKGPITSADIIVQCESLHRLNLDVAPYVLILDEVESIIKQLFASTQRFPERVMQTFVKLIKESSIVWCIDANLSQTVINIVKSIRGDNSILYYLSLIHI
jgi:hypothetical protein